MSPWTALLESLHSALIDELTERRPEPKPELGMPQRHRELKLPGEEVASALICEVSFAGAGGAEESRGFACLATDPDCARLLGVDQRGLWDALLRRAGGEFMFRGIKPRLGDVKVLKAGESATGWITPSRVIWIPFRLHPGCCYLGVGAS